MCETQGAIGASSGLMTISTTDFPTWFFAGFYGGLGCCVLTIVISFRALYTNIRRRVISRRLVVCIASSLCLLPTFIWFRMDFNAQVSFAEVTALLSCVVFFGWLLPIGVTLFASIMSRSPFSVIGKSEEQKEKKELSGGSWYPPRYQSGVMAPFVFSAETPWGWLEYRSGNFQGQRLALKRSIITLGRAENSDIWLDDDMASRRHAEIAWDNHSVYLTDCESLNSTRLNSRRVRGSVPLSSEDIIAIGTHRFLFLLAEQKMVAADEYDPLVNHKWRSSFELQDGRGTAQHSVPLPTTKPLIHSDQAKTASESQQDESAPSAQKFVPFNTPLSNGPMPLRLPSRPKES
jgi:FHA domain